MSVCKFKLILDFALEMVNSVSKFELEKLTERGENEMFLQAYFY